MLGSEPRLAEHATSSEISRSTSSNLEEIPVATHHSRYATGMV